jgi:hypothetical protein
MMKLIVEFRNFAKASKRAHLISQKNATDLFQFTGFRRSVDEIFSLLGYNAEIVGS